MGIYTAIKSHTVSTKGEINQGENMELANIRSLAFADKSEKYDHESWRGKVPTYLQARELSPIVVDDFLCVNSEKKNRDLLSWYLQSDFELIPIHRQTNPHLASKLS